MSSMKASDYSITEIQLSNRFPSKTNLQDLQNVFNINESKTMYRTGKKLIHICLQQKKKESVLGKHVLKQKHHGRIQNNLI